MQAGAGSGTLGQQAHLGYRGLPAAFKPPVVEVVKRSWFSTVSLIKDQYAPPAPRRGGLKCHL